MRRQKRYLRCTVFDAALARLRALYAEGARVVVSFSGGKDSTVALELAALAAGAEGRLPVDVAFRDEEVQLPGTFEYVGRVARRPEVNLRWFWAEHPVANCLGPPWRMFDPSRRWMREPPAYAIRRPSLYLAGLVDPAYFPFPQCPSCPVDCDHCGREQAVTAGAAVKQCSHCGKVFAVDWRGVDLTGDVYVLIGCRADESPFRRMGVASMGGHVARTLNYNGTTNVWPIYDWTAGDVWKAILDHGWDYDRAYDGMTGAASLGVRWPVRDMRIASLTICKGACANLSRAAAVWPEWHRAVCERIPGVQPLPCRPGPAPALPATSLAAALYSEAWEYD
jgi:predicted phosphoadenosine phosphosulfate sulfurtransferase